MTAQVRRQIVRLLSGKRRRDEYLAALAMMAIVVVAAVAAVLTQQGHAATQEVRVLDCQFDGIAAHTHDESCYDADGNLVCPLPEREAHAHDESCYAEERVLVCGLEEGEGHTHTDECYEVTRTLVCGRDEVTEAHVHGPGCFRTVEVEVPDEELADDKANDQDSTGAGSSEPAAADREPTSQTHPRQSFSHEFTDADGNLVMRVEVEAPEGALPVGTTMAATWIDPATMSQKQQDAVDGAVAAKAGGQVMGMQAVDIEFLDADGTEVEPAAPVVVTMTSGLVDTDDAPMVVHIDDLTDAQLHQQEQDLRDGKSAEEAEPTRTAEALDQLSDQALERRDIATGDDRLSFESDRFSTYVLAVTSLRKVMQASDGATVTVTVDAPAEAGIPQGAELQVREVAQGSADWQGYEERALAALDADEAALARFFDIAIVGEDGAEVQPAEPVSVEIELADAPEGADASVVHFGGAPEVVPATEDAGVAAFDAESFSVWGVVYTVDFHWNVDGEVYEYSLAGGDSIGLRKLVEILGIVDAQADDADATLDEFIANVESVNFSDESLVKVAKVTEGITAGALKQKLGLECEYSAELTAVEREAMDDKVFYAPDWALISLKAFDTNEFLTVEMKNGEVLRIAVTDAQIQKDYLSASGETYTITVTYEDDAEIPDKSDLQVEEIRGGTDEYNQYLSESAEKIGVESADVSFARFFDITIVDKDGNKVEPKAPVSVNIAYKDALEIGDDQSLSIVHFSEDGTEVINDTSISEDQKEITYQQDSFSVTGTVVTNPTSGNSYMVLIKGPVIEGQNVYYIVNNDGTLSPVAADLNPNGTIRAVHVTEPMAWKYRDNHLYHEYDALTYNSNHAASEFVYRYLDPRAASGITTESNDDVTLGNYNPWTQMYENSRRRLWQNTGVTYNVSSHTLSGNNNYLGVAADEDGTLRIAGNKSASDAVEIYFARPDVAAPVASNNAVNHIDISVKGSSEIKVPLAYGDYFDSNGNKILEVSRTNEKTITTESPVKIELADMKRAVITAYQKDTDGTIIPLDDAFYISGFSQNDPSGIGSTGDARQIRIEGSFLTSKSIHGEDINAFDYATQTYKNRLNDRVYYTVSVTKPIEFVLKDGDTELYDSTGKKLTITLDITMTASFDYWDIRNDCPPLRLEMGNGSTYVDENGQNFRNWRSGGYTNWTGNITGMDFKLGGDAEEANSNIVAIEITKYIVDQDGNLIHPDNNITQAFDIWGSSTDNSNNVINIDVPSYNNDNDSYDRSSYSYLHSKDVKVGSSGMALIYDYDITPGMYFIREDPSTIQQELEADNEVWQYKETRIETEFVWRNDDTTGRHVSATYNDLNTTDSESYISVPEVVGNYTGKHYHNAAGHEESSDYDSQVFYGENENHQLEDDQQFRNGFLEFFVYNVYTKKNIDVVIEKVDKDDVSEESPKTLPGATFRLEKYTAGTCAASEKDSTWTDVTIADNDNDGEFTFTELTEGYYKLVETVCPAGYVKNAADPVFHVKPDDDGDLIVVLVDEDGKDMDETQTELLKIDNDAASGHVLTVGNEPGMPLPNAGGPGTGAYMTIGAALMTGSALLLLRRRRTT